VKQVISETTETHCKMCKVQHDRSLELPGNKKQYKTVKTRVSFLSLFRRYNRAGR